MVADRISTSDIRGIGKGGCLKIQLPNYAACVSAKNLVGYVKKMYPREDGMTYTCSIDSEKFIISIRLVEASELKNRKRSNKK